jgi:subtilase family serine protease
MAACGLVARTRVWRLAALAAIGVLLAGGSTAVARASGRVGPNRPVAAGQELRLVLPLVANLQGLRRYAQAVTTLGSPSYGQFRSIPWLAQRFGASAPRRSRVVAFLRAAGATGVRIDATGLFADADLPAATAGRLFATRLIAHAARRGSYTAPAGPVALPGGLRGLATGVVGLDTRPLARGNSPQLAAASAAGARAAGARAAGASGVPSAYEPRSGTPAGCAGALAAGGFTPNQYLTAYGFDPLHRASILGQGERAAVIEIDGFKAGDVHTFAACFGLRLPKITAFGVGVNRPLPPGGEATLDLEVLDAAAPGLRGIDVYESGAQAGLVLRALTAPLQNAGFKPQVISASLGLCEQQTREAVGRAGIAASEAALEMAAASGISFLSASGDDGSADCVNGTSQSAPPEPELAVNYPASSPWATGVGGTNIALTTANALAAQDVWNDGSLEPGAAGGGGLSALFGRPRYQNGTVTGTRRAVPDVALLADIAPGYTIYCSTSDCRNPGGPWQTVGGTSAATPLMAGGLALIDQSLRENQLQDLGLVNPLLYALGRDPSEAGQVFYDVTNGSNDVGPYIRSGGAPLGCCSAGAGFDYASGWGGVNINNLWLAAKARQPHVVNISLALPRHQSPVRWHHILARITCSGPCLAGALARITIGHGRPFTVYSDLNRLAHGAGRTITIGFSRAQLSRLRAALRHRARIVAAVIGAIVDAGGNIERRSRTLTLHVTR